MCETTTRPTPDLQTRVNTVPELTWHGLWYSGLQVDRPRFAQDTAPDLCLPFDGIGARHPRLTLGEMPGLNEIKM